MLGQDGPGVGRLEGQRLKDTQSHRQGNPGGFPEKGISRSEDPWQLLPQEHSTCHFLTHHPIQLAASVYLFLNSRHMRPPSGKPSQPPSPAGLRRLLWLPWPSAQPLEALLARTLGPAGPLQDLAQLWMSGLCDLCPCRWCVSPEHPPGCVSSCVQALLILRLLRSLVVPRWDWALLPTD